MAQQLIFWFFSPAESDNQRLSELASLPTMGIVLEALDKHYKKKTCNWPGNQNTN